MQATIILLCHLHHKLQLAVDTIQTHPLDSRVSMHTHSHANLATLSHYVGVAELQPNLTAHRGDRYWRLDIFHASWDTNNHTFTRLRFHSSSIELELSCIQGAVHGF